MASNDDVDDDAMTMVDDGDGAMVDDAGKKLPSYADPTPKEQDSMMRIKTWLKRDGLAMPSTMTHEECGGEDRAILKFIRARKTAEKSYEMLTKTLEWRKANGVDRCLEMPISAEHLIHVREIPAFYCGFGKTGHPVYLEHTAAIPWDTILANMTTDEFLVSQVQTLEWQASVVFPEASRRAGDAITQVINVWDLKGLTLSGFSSEVRALVKKASALAQDNYPEGLYAAYIINAPKIFSMVWAVVKQFLDAKTVAKVHIYGSGDKMWNKLMDRLGEGVTLRKEMVCCSKADIGKPEAEYGLQGAHGATQRWIRDRIAGRESDFGSAPGVLRRESSVKDMFDIFFDASEELCAPELASFNNRSSVNSRSSSVNNRSSSVRLSAAQPAVESVSPSKSKKCCC